MSVNHKIWEFPSFRISKQLFAASGTSFEGGMTVGGVRMSSPEPGGRSMLEIQPSLQTGEWEYPLSSWLMSKINGDIFRIRLAPTPQVAGRNSGTPWGAGGIYPDSPWSNQQNWSGDAVAQFKSVALEGSNVVQIDMSALGRILQRGHAIGPAPHGCYMIDDISYSDVNNVATIIVNPPLRKSIAVNDLAYLRPFFLGSISNGDEMRTTYDAENVGYIQLGRIKFSEVIL